MEAVVVDDSTANDIVPPLHRTSSVGDVKLPDPLPRRRDPSVDSIQASFCSAYAPTKLPECKENQVAREEGNKTGGRGQGGDRRAR